MLPRCGRAAHICEANYFATSSPCCNCTFLKLSNSQLIIFMKQVANSDKATGQLLHAGRQKQQPTWKNSLFSRIVSCETLLLGEQLALHFRRCPALLSLRDISPHCGESPSSAELSQLDRFCLRLVAYSFSSKSSSSHFVSSRHSPMSRLVVVTVNDCIRRISS